MEIEELSFKLLKKLKPHVSEDNPFQGSDNPNTAKKIELFTNLAYALKAYLLFVDIPEDMRKEVEEIEIY